MSAGLGLPLIISVSSTRMMTVERRLASNNAVSKWAPVGRESHREAARIFWKKEWIPDPECPG